MGAKKNFPLIVLCEPLRLTKCNNSKKANLGRIAHSRDFFLIQKRGSLGKRKETMSRKNKTPRRHDWRGIHNNLIAMHKATFIESAIYLTIIPRRARMGSELIAP